MASDGDLFWRIGAVAVFFAAVSWRRLKRKLWFWKNNAWLSVIFLPEAGLFLERTLSPGIGTLEDL